jgi:hypothetical protein
MMQLQVTIQMNFRTLDERIVTCMHDMHARYQCDVHAVGNMACVDNRCYGKG